MPQIVYTAMNPGGQLQSSPMDAIRDRQADRNLQAQLAMQRLAQQQQQFEAGMGDRDTDRDFEREILERKLGFQSQAADKGFAQKKELAGLGHEYDIDLLGRTQDFAAEQGQVDRDFRAGESEADRALRRMLQERGFGHDVDLLNRRQDFQSDMSEQEWMRSAESRELLRQLRQAELQRARSDAARRQQEEEERRMVQGQLQQTGELGSALVSEYYPRYEPTGEPTGEQEVPIEELAAEAQAAEGRDPITFMNRVRMIEERTGKSMMSNEAKGQVIEQIQNRAADFLDRARKQGGPEGVVIARQKLFKDINNALGNTPEADELKNRIVEMSETGVSPMDVIRAESLTNPAGPGFAATGLFGVPGLLYRGARAMMD